MKNVFKFMKNIFAKPKDRFMDAVRENDMEKVKEKLKKDPDLAKAGSKHENSPLHMAAVNDNLEAAEMFIEKGADVNGTNRIGWTPLHCAAQGKSVKMMELLLRNGAKTDFHDNNGWTPLFWAASNGSVEAARLLLKNKANVNARNTVGKTPLTVAREKGNKKVAKILEEKGGKV